MEDTIVVNARGANPYIYQNPLLNPTNAAKNIGPVPVLSTEMFWPEIKQSYDFMPGKKSQQNSGTLRIPQKPEQWAEFADHSEFIATMFHNVRKDAAEDQFARVDTTNALLKVKTLNAENLDADHSTSSAGGRISKTRKLEAPWKNASNFASPSALRQQTFQNFNKMAPEPPKTPLTVGERHVRISSDLPHQKKPPPRPEENVVIGRKMELVPAPRDPDSAVSAFPKPKPRAVRLPTNQSLPSRPSALQKGTTNMEQRPPVNVQPIIAVNSYQPSQSFRPQTFFEEREYEYNVKPPLPLSKRKENLPQNQPTLYHSMYYGSGKRYGSQTPAPTQMPNQIRGKKAFGNNKKEGNNLGGQLSGTSRDTRQQKPHVAPTAAPGGPNFPRRQTAKKVRPAMLFPFHVPGPKHDNIYISDYHGSDSESEPDVKKDSKAGSYH